MLEILSRVVTSGMGRVGIVTAARAIALAASVESWVRRDSLLDTISRSLLRHLSLRPNDPVFDFLRQVSVDQAAIIQITPECMDLFNSAAVPRPEVDYGCVVTGVPMPPRAYHPTDLLSPERVALGGLFLCVWAVTAREHKRYPYPVPSRRVIEQLAAVLPEVDSSTNDGIVPTLSQVYGDLVCAVASDHYDVLGRFDDAGRALSDWLPSGSGFDEDRFLHVWNCVADRIASSEVSHQTGPTSAQAVA
jgi:triacylglycerol lipase